MPFILFLCRTWAHAPPESTLQLGLLSARLLSFVLFADPYSASQSRVATSAIDYLLHGIRLSADGATTARKGYERLGCGLAA